MITHRFIKEEVENGYVLRPKIPVIMKGSKAKMNFLALLDSGADVTILHKSIADFLGVKYDSKSKSKFYSFSKEPFQCASGKVDMIFPARANRIQEKLVNVPVLVALTGEEKEPLLGCEKIFDTFKITFTQRKKIQLSKPTKKTW